jgi:phosphoglycolate phosphatase-like HAD superfamily hydrolase
MTPIRALILDFDGVILESNGLKTQAFAAVFARFPEHAAAMMEYHHSHVSESRFAKFAHLAHARLGLPPGDRLVDELAAAFSADMLERMQSCPMVQGASEFLTRARRAVPIYLASVTPQQELETILERRGFAEWFVRVYGCPPWTKRGAVIDIVSAAGGPQGIVFVGDSAGDQRAALAAGVEFVARDSGLPFDDPQPTAFPDLARMERALAPRLVERTRGPQ